MPDRRILTLDDLTELAEVKLDLSTVTLGEAAEAEKSSGWALAEILKSTIARRVLAMFLHGYRNYDEWPSWNELASLRAVDVSSSTSDSDSVSRSET